MSDPSFFTNFNQSQFTFHTDYPPPTFIPPPPMPPPFYITSIPAPQNNLDLQHTCDQDYIKKFEPKMIFQKKVKKLKLPSISKVRMELRNMVIMLNELKDKEKMLLENINKLTESEWKSNMEEVEKNKAKLNNILSQINDNYLDMLRKVTANRAAKRLRLKRLHLERKTEKEAWIKKCQERSRQINENLQKIKNDIIKIKQEQKAKIQADSVLKDVLRKKNDARKCLVKLDALMKLRRARQNTAKGRGDLISESDAEAFNRNIEKLKSLWTKKLVIYEKEENDLRATLKQESLEESCNNNEKEVLDNLAKWRECLFGDGNILPQFDFQQDIEKFVAVRSQWDQFIDEEGSSIPMGWVMPIGKM